MPEAVLVLEDGTSFSGESIGMTGETTGEVVFNTTMTGYEEILTDPSYYGQIVTMTYPLIGNYGINDKNLGLDLVQVHGFVVNELCMAPSNWKALKNLNTFLKENGIIGISGIDTRALTRKLRDAGTMKGIISTKSDDMKTLLEKVKASPDINGEDLVKKVSISSPINIPGDNERVVVIDLGSKANTLELLKGYGCHITLLPCDTKANDILSMKPDGVLFSNGPGDPKRLPYVVETVKELIGKLPIFGICLGHQVIGLALGGDTFKMKFGHRGANHPVRNMETGKVYITSQNHGYSVKGDSLDSDKVFISHVNVNDGTIEGLCYREYPIFSLQYYPEVSLELGDSGYFFKKFIISMRENQKQFKVAKARDGRSEWR